MQDPLSPTSKSSRSDSRTSFGSIFEGSGSGHLVERSLERVRLDTYILSFFRLYYPRSSALDVKDLVTVSVPAAVLRVLRESGRPRRPAPLLPLHTGQPRVLLQLRPPAGGGGPLRPHQPSALRPHRGQHLHQVPRQITIVHRMTHPLF